MIPTLIAFPAIHKIVFIWNIAASITNTNITNTNKRIDETNKRVSVLEELGLVKKNGVLFCRHRKES